MQLYEVITDGPTIYVVSEDLPSAYQKARDFCSEWSIKAVSLLAQTQRGPNGGILLVPEGLEAQLLEDRGGER